MKKPSGSSKFLYIEWLFPIFGYYIVLHLNEFIFDILFPFIISIACSLLYHKNDLIIIALNHLSTILPSVISILIGFTVMLITLLLSGNENSISKLKCKFIENKKLWDKPVTLHQYLLLQFIRSLIAEIALIILVFLYLFLSPFQLPVIVYTVFLVFQVHYLLSILFSIARGLVNIFFAFYGKPSK